MNNHTILKRGVRIATIAVLGAVLSFAFLFNAKPASISAPFAASVLAPSQYSDPIILAHATKVGDELYQLRFELDLGREDYPHFDTIDLMLDTEDVSLETIGEESDLPLVLTPEETRYLGTSSIHFARGGYNGSSRVAHVGDVTVRAPHGVQGLRLVPRMSSIKYFDGTTVQSQYTFTQDIVVTN